MNLSVGEGISTSSCTVIDTEFDGYSGRAYSFKLDRLVNRISASFSGEGEAKFQLRKALLGQETNSRPDKLWTKLLR